MDPKDFAKAGIVAPLTPYFAEQTVEKWAESASPSSTSSLLTAVSTAASNSGPEVDANGFWIPKPLKRGQRYYASNLTAEDKEYLKRGGDVKKWSPSDFAEKAIVQPEHLRGSDTQDQAKEQRLSPSAGGKENHGVSSAPGTTVSSRKAHQSIQHGNRRAVSFQIPESKGTTFDDFLEPHVSGKGEAYRGAENAVPAATVSEGSMMAIMTDKPGKKKKRRGRKGGNKANRGEKN